MEKIRVLHVLNTGNYAGAEHVAVDIIDSTKETTESAYVSPNGIISEVLRKKEIKHYIVNGLSWRILSDVVTDFQPDVIHAHDFTASVLSGFVRSKARVISHIHHNAPWIGKWCLKSIAYRLVTNRISRVLFVSKVTRDDYLFAEMIKGKSIIIGNPIDADRIKQLASADGKDVEKYDVLYVGRMEYAKNPLRFIDIISAVRMDNPQIRAAMIGEGELIEDIKVAIERNNLSDTVKILGFIQNPYPYMKNARIMCVPSRWEGFGLVAAESIILETPVVASDVGELRNIISTDCGVLCHSNEEFVNGIRKLLIDNNQELSVYRSNCQQKSKMLDTKENYMRKISEIYQELVNNG